MGFNWITLGLGIGLASNDILAFPLVKYVSLGANPIWLLVSAIIYATSPILLYYSLQYEGLAIMNVLWNTLSTCIITLLGIYMFKEKLSTTKCLCIAISILGIGLLVYETT